MKKRVFSTLLALALIISTLCTVPAKAAEIKTIDDYYALVEATESGSELLPTKFDLRDYGLVTPVRRQGRYGTCWAFAAVAALESNALVKGLGTYDLSERYVAWCAKHVIETNDNNINGEGVTTNREEWCSNGSPDAVAYTIMNGYGLGFESDYPYADIMKDIADDELGKEILRCKSVTTVDRTDLLAIKQAIVNYGASTASIPWTNDSKVFNSRKKSVYMSKEFNDKNKVRQGHVIAIIGWDDNYSKANFGTTPPGDGAWICKDSGGCNYLYISYYTYLRPEYDSLVYSFEVAPLQLHDSSYKYDGGVGLTEVKSTNDIAISFKANKDETLTGVAVKLEGKTQATIRVYENAESTANLNESNCIYTQTVNITENGYQTLQFSKGVNISANENTLVVVHFSNPVTYYIDSSWNRDDMTNHASANPNETFIKKDNGNWEDLFNYSRASACIKVLSRNGHNRRPLTLSNSNLTVDNTKEATIDLTWKAVEGAESYEIYRKAEGEWNYTLLKTVSNTTLKYSDTKLTLGKKYTYKVIPVAGNVEGFSAEKTLTATIAATWIKKLDNSKSGKITITINKTKSAKSYSVYRLTGKEYKWIGNTTTGTFVDKNVTSGNTYTYKVKANKGSLSSAYSTAKSSKAK